MLLPFSIKIVTIIIYKHQLCLLNVPNELFLYNISLLAQIRKKLIANIKHQKGCINHKKCLISSQNPLPMYLAPSQIEI